MSPVEQCASFRAQNKSRDLPQKHISRPLPYDWMQSSSHESTVRGHDQEHFRGYSIQTMTYAKAKLARTGLPRHLPEFGKLTGEVIFRINLLTCTCHVDVSQHFYYICTTAYVFFALHLLLRYL